MRYGGAVGDFAAMRSWAATLSGKTSSKYVTRTPKNDENIWRIMSLLSFSGVCNVHASEAISVDTVNRCVRVSARAVLLQCLTGGMIIRQSDGFVGRIISVTSHADKIIATVEWNVPASASHSSCYHVEPNIDTSSWDLRVPVRASASTWEEILPAVAADQHEADTNAAFTEASDTLLSMDADAAADETRQESDVRADFAYLEVGKMNELHGSLSATVDTLPDNFAERVHAMVTGTMPRKDSARKAGEKDGDTTSGSERVLPPNLLSAIPERARGTPTGKTTVRHPRKLKPVPAGQALYPAARGFQAMRDSGYAHKRAAAIDAFHQKEDAFARIVKHADFDGVYHATARSTLYDVSDGSPSFTPSPTFVPNKWAEMSSRLEQLTECVERAIDSGDWDTWTETEREAKQTELKDLQRALFSSADTEYIEQAMREAGIVPDNFWDDM